MTQNYALTKMCMTTLASLVMNEKLVLGHEVDLNGVRLLSPLMPDDDLKEGLDYTLSLALNAQDIARGLSTRHNKNPTKNSVVTGVQRVTCAYKQNKITASDLPAKMQKEIRAMQDIILDSRLNTVLRTLGNLDHEAVADKLIVVKRSTDLIKNLRCCASAVLQRKNDYKPETVEAMQMLQRSYHQTARDHLQQVSENAYARWERHGLLVPHTGS